MVYNVDKIQTVKDVELNPAQFTPKQKLFIQIWDGNVNTTAKESGGELSVRYCRELCKNTHIIAAIKLRDGDKPEDRRIASRKDRQEFWSDTMEGTEHQMPNRLRASELLGKSECDFVEKVVHEHGLQIPKDPIEAIAWHRAGIADIEAGMAAEQDCKEVDCICKE